MEFLRGAPAHWEASHSDALMNLVVDESDNSYKIFFIYRGFQELPTFCDDSDDSVLVLCTFTNPPPKMAERYQPALTA